MDSLKKMLWIFSKSLRFCFWPIIFSVLFLITSSLLSLIVNIINKDIINVLEKVSNWEYLTVFSSDCY